MSKKKKKTIEELIEEALLPEEEQPYEVPENWSWTKFGTVAKVYNGYAFKSTDYQEEGIPVIRISDISGENTSHKKAIRVPPYLYNERFLIRKGDLLIAMSGATTGKTGFYNSDEIALQNQRVGNIKETSQQVLYSKFKNYYVLNNSKEILKKAYGGAQPNISGNLIEQLSFPLPPLNEQKRIAEKVERLLNKIEEAKQLIEEAKETFELRRAAILDKAFRGELTAKWREKNLEIESGVMRLEKIKNERFQIVESKRELSEIAIMFDELNTEECIDNNNWLYLKANMFCYNINCGSTPSKDITEEGEIPFLKVYNIVKNKVSFSYKPQYIPKEVHESKLKRSILKPNDVIMNIVGPPLKKIAIIPEEYPEMNMNQAIVRFRSIKYVLPKYLYFCLQYDETLKEVINETRGVVGQSNISVSQSRNLVMPIPSLEEQAVIVNKLEELIEREEVVLNLIPDKRNLEELKQSIMSKAFRGELGTNDPSEENVIELLKEVLQEQVK